MIPRKPGPAILMYHRIATETFDPWSLVVRPDRFAEQAEWLARNRTILPLTEFATANRKRKLPQDAVAITFDDGYACTFNTAGPVLGALGLPATVFIPADPLRQGGQFWWDELEQIAMSFEGTSLTVDGLETKLGARSEQDRKWRPYDPPRTPRQEAFRRLWSIIRGKPGQAVAATMSDLRRQFGHAPASRPSHRIATIEEAKSASATFEYGCHGLTHAAMPTLGRPDQVREIEVGRALLTELIGIAPATFGFPFGDSDRTTERMVESAGFQCACGSRQKFVSASDSQFALPRLAVEDVSATGLQRMLSGR